jgi:hypothetical protein
VLEHLRGASCCGVAGYSAWIGCSGAASHYGGEVAICVSGPPRQRWPHGAMIPLHNGQWRGEFRTCIRAGSLSGRPPRAGRPFFTYLGSTLRCVAALSAVGLARTRGWGPQWPGAPRRKIHSGGMWMMGRGRRSLGLVRPFPPAVWVWSGSAVGGGPEQPPSPVDLTLC